MADVEAPLNQWGHSTLGFRFVTELPAGLLGILGTAADPGTPVVQLVRVGGPTDDNNPRFDRPTLAVDAFGYDRASAKATAWAVHGALRTVLPGLTLDGLTVCKVQTITAPHWIAYDDTNLRRFNASYQLHVKART